ncbi:MAG: UDP-N-acetyl-D-glucosamine 6-dehydrogenase [Verrucomicrobia subdivision 3 bacterium]|nr:UDP-N-acetyl-D-glucosamine 6-dehydrogenase [Limisphaerales bacterium]MCS1415852.1 UDP-N-acetyl-D-glucosamine 6-dehydrogenase [Limisphaerales bacterium]
MKIGIIGLGYVGLPLCLQFGRSGAEVLGIDVDQEKVDLINRGKSFIKHIESAEIEKLTINGRLRATTEIAEASGCDGVLICVPTPLNKYREPDLGYVFSTGEKLAPFITKGMTVVLESTTYPGTTDEDLRAILERRSGKRAGTDFYLAYSPEREDPGNPDSQVGKIPKVVGGCTPTCQAKAAAIYKTAIETIVPVSNCRAAEATKLLENIFRSVNIALVNELKVIYDQMGIDVWEVIEAAKTKPFGYKAFYPGPGLGGHCIPIDPFYLTWKARQYGISTRFIELAGEINTAMPEYVIQRTMDVLNQRGKALNGAKILIIGLAYKANVDDDRESPSYRLMELFREKLATVDYYDPYIPVIRPKREYSHFKGKASVSWKEEQISAYDAVVISTAHQNVNYKELGNWASCIIDTRDVMNGVELVDGRVIKA